MRVVYYVNQFFGQLGGESAAGTSVQVWEKAVGPAAAVARAGLDGAHVVATLAAGDNWVNEALVERVAQICDAIVAFQPDFVLAGPAFGAGRYGMAVGAVVAELDHRGITAVGAMSDDNPALPIYRRDGYFIDSGTSPVRMAAVVQTMATLAARLWQEGDQGPSQMGYLPRGRRRMQRQAQSAAARAVTMLLAKLEGGPYRTEVAIPRQVEHHWASALPALERVQIVLATDGGVVPCANPDRIEASMATKWGRYPLSMLECLEVHHGGYDNAVANQDPHRVLPADSLERLAAAGVIGGIYPYWFTTAGNATAVALAEQMADAMAQELLPYRGSIAVLLTST